MIYAIAAVLVLILDQAVKFWTTKNILLDAIGDDCVSLIPGVLHMTNVHNYGAAFSILENARWLLVVVSVIFVVGIIILLSQEIIHTRFGKWTAVLVMAGALGNCIDRILYGYVVDMFELELFTFAVFNVADIFITVCGILFCIHVIFYREPVEVRTANESAAARRRREEREAKEAPYAAIPHRGEHKSLEEELRIADPDDPFAEWNFEDIVDDPAPSEPEPPAAPVRRQPEEEPDDDFELPQPRRRAPARRQAEEAADDGPAPSQSRRLAASPKPLEEESYDDFELPQPRHRSPARSAAPKPAPAEEPADDFTDGFLDDEPAEEFSLEDILSEFDDFS